MLARMHLGERKSPHSTRNSIVENPVSVEDRKFTEAQTNDRLAVRIRHAVKQAWMTILDEQSFQADTQWHEAGGDSLDALRLLQSIERELNTQLPLETLTQSITPTKLLSAVEIILKSNKAEAHVGRQLPLVFFFPHAHGDTPSLAEFRSIMKDRIRFVVIRYPQLRDMVRGGGRFDLLVDTAEAQIRARCSEKPCLMVGTSFSGFVAWETARRLTAVGRRVGFLGLIDSRLVEQPSGFFQRVRNVFTREWWRSEYFARLRRPIMRIFIVTARSVAMYFPLSVLGQIDRLVMLLPQKASFEFRLALVSQLRAKSLRKDLLRPLGVPTVLFRSDEYATGFPDHGWNRLCDQLVVVPIRGSHVSMNSEELCATLVQMVETIRSAVKIESGGRDPQSPFVIGKSGRG